MKRVLVCGGRDYTDMLCVDRTLKTVHLKHGIGILIHGACEGADSLCRDWAEAHGIHAAGVEALWSFYGNPAGPKRNAAMLILQPELLVAFPGGKGTANMVRQATEAGVPLHRASDLP
jgi:hypothetical protein